MKLMELIARAPWREAVTYRETWPHEYVLIKQDKQRELLAAICARIANGEGIEGPSTSFFQSGLLPRNVVPYSCTNAPRVQHGAAPQCAGLSTTGSGSHSHAPSSSMMVTPALS